MDGVAPSVVLPEAIAVEQIMPDHVRIHEVFSYVDFQKI